jgi:hypothetical protein
MRIGKVTNNLGPSKGPGGGLKSAVNREVSIRTGKPAKGQNPAAVAQTGVAVDPKAVEKRLSPDSFRSGVPLGNEGTLITGGKGEGRTLYGQSGTQGVHGPVAQTAPRAQGSDILKGYGPERTGGKP